MEIQSESALTDRENCWLWEGRMHWQRRLNHDFANLLTALLSLTDDCLDDLSAPAALRENLLEMKTCLEASSHLVRLCGLTQHATGPVLLKANEWWCRHWPRLRTLLPRTLTCHFAAESPEVFLEVSEKAFLDLALQLTVLARQLEESSMLRISTSRPGNGWLLTWEWQGRLLLSQKEFSARKDFLRSLTGTMGGSLSGEETPSGRLLRFSFSVVED